MSFHLIIGSMFSSKTVALTNQATKAADLGVSVLYVRHSFDTQRVTQGGTTQFGCHSSSNKFITEKVNLIETHELRNIADCQGYKFIFIDEIQFYPDSVETIDKWMNLGINVVAGGLSGDFDRKPIGRIGELIPLATKITHKRALCVRCLEEKNVYRKACYTHLKDKNLICGSSNVIPGGNEKYEALCLDHYLEQNRDNWSGNNWSD